MVDVMLIILGVLLIAWHTWRGFFKSLLSVVRLVASVVLSWLITPLVFGDGALARCIGCLVVFAVIYIALTFVLKLMDKIIKNITGLKTANRLLGFLLGCFCAYIFISFAVVFIGIFAKFAPDGFMGMTQAELSESTVLYVFFEKFGAFSLISK